MLEYISHPDSNVVELTIAGKITEADFDRVTAQMRVDIENHGKLRILEEVRSFEGLDPIVLWKDARFGAAHVGDFTHVAVVADAGWVRTLTAAADSVLSAKVKAFEGSQLPEARAWLMTAPEPHQESKLEYVSHPDSNVVEIIVEGKIAEADFDRVLALAKADFAKHGKLKVLEEIRSFEGVDPMVLWKDIQQAALVKDITHAAIVADAKWLRTLAEAMGTILPAQIKAFERSQIEAARVWLMNA